MNKVEYLLFKRLIKDNKEMKEQIDYLVEAVNLLVQIETEKIKNNFKKN